MQKSEWPTVKFKDTVKRNEDDNVMMYMTWYTEVNLFGIEFDDVKFKTILYGTTKNFC